MENQDQTSNVPISNWTRSTGTKPFERYVYFGTSPDNSSQDGAKNKRVAG